MTQSKYETFEDLKVRLDEIVAAVSDDTMPLDDALTLYEEAVSLGLRATDLLEANIEQQQTDETAEIASDETATEMADKTTGDTADEEADKTTNEREDVCEDTI